MLHFAPLHDYELIRETIANPKIYAHVSDDGSPSREDFIPADHPAIVYLGAYEGTEYLGLWMLCPANSICWDVHTCLLPSSWGALATQATKAAIEWVFENTDCRRLITSVPSTNRLALKLAEHSGMTRYGVNPSSFLKNGKLLDQILLGISKADQSCQ